MKAWNSPTMPTAGPIWARKPSQLFIASPSTLLYNKVMATQYTKADLRAFALDFVASMVARNVSPGAVCADLEMYEMGVMGWIDSWAERRKDFNNAAPKTDREFFLRELRALFESALEEVSKLDTLDDMFTKLGEIADVIKATSDGDFSPLQEKSTK